MTEATFLLFLLCLYFPIVALTPLVSLTSFVNLTVFYVYDPLTDGGNLVKSIFKRLNTFFFFFFIVLFNYFNTCL